MSIFSKLFGRGQGSVEADPEPSDAPSRPADAPPPAPPPVAGSEPPPTPVSEPPPSEGTARWRIRRKARKNPTPIPPEPGPRGRTGTLLGPGVRRSSAPPPGERRDTPTIEVRPSSAPRARRVASPTLVGGSRRRRVRTEPGLSSIPPPTWPPEEPSQPEPPRAPIPAGVTLVSEQGDEPDRITPVGWIGPPRGDQSVPPEPSLPPVAISELPLHHPPPHVPTLRAPPHVETLRAPAAFPVAYTPVPPDGPTALTDRPALPENTPPAETIPDEALPVQTLPDEPPAETLTGEMLTGETPPAETLTGEPAETLTGEPAETLTGETPPAERLPDEAITDAPPCGEAPLAEALPEAIRPDDQTLSGAPHPEETLPEAALPDGSLAADAQATALPEAAELPPEDEPPVPASRPAETATRMSAAALRSALETSSDAPPRSTRSSYPDALLDDIDLAWDTIVSAEPMVAGSASDRADLPIDESVRELFGQIASGYARQLRDFMLELSLGDAPLRWLEICRPSVRSIRAAGDKLELHELTRGLDALAAAFDAVELASGPSIAGEGRERILETYTNLMAVHPTVFALPDEHGERETFLVHALLEQVPGVFLVTIDKLYAAGLTSLSTLRMASGEELAATAGIRVDLARAIVDRFRDHQQEREAADTDTLRPTSELRRLAEELGHAQEAFVAAAADDDRSATRRLRRERNDLLLQVKVILAQFGEVEVLREVDLAPFADKLTLLEACLERLEPEEE